MQRKGEIGKKENVRGGGSGERERKNGAEKEEDRDTILPNLKEKSLPWDGFALRCSVRCPLPSQKMAL
jgi:hypothetical protein